jgi:hypothetical protein
VKEAGRTLLLTGPDCFVKADDCSGAYTAFKAAWKVDPFLPDREKNTDENGLRRAFEGRIVKCRGK